MNEYSTLFLAQINEKQNEPAVLDKKKADDKKRLEEKKKARDSKISQLKVKYYFSVLLTFDSKNILENREELPKQWEH